jgi:hypothetical protein
LSVVNKGPLLDKSCQQYPVSAVDDILATSDKYPEGNKG